MHSRAAAIQEGRNPHNPILIYEHRVVTPSSASVLDLPGYEFPSQKTATSDIRAIDRTVSFIEVTAVVRLPLRSECDMTCIDMTSLVGQREYIFQQTKDTPSLFLLFLRVASLGAVTSRIFRASRSHIPFLVICVNK